MTGQFRQQSQHFETKIYIETVTKVDFCLHPFKLRREGAEVVKSDTTSSVEIATGATAKRMLFPDEGIYWQSGISDCAVL
ncbi:hypothetical protein K493DRAFT_383776 [Basidiobolus meristosporus CBS 931.73]|uniref:Uncharacterized protein n=1 Tax=Basidiobolus meristosporus CBS 931.73 TaxID=1314790 RepID=A0A1Y1YZF8_9FUNG|nr:hypothetical protein K493DRAFT_383776 [Basidiobolus meristosporus CBS 931.73]|eukprot:ORY03254.1 hypothetical protein K493DRAFT_383776 [Basidiobolus meristosporus CBS 931.73]